jgi:hypothetical protein
MPFPWCVKSQEAEHDPYSQRQEKSGAYPCAPFLGRELTPLVPDPQQSRNKRKKKQRPESNHVEASHHCGPPAAPESHRRACNPGVDPRGRTPRRAWAADPSAKSIGWSWQGGLSTGERTQKTPEIAYLSAWASKSQANGAAPARSGNQQKARLGRRAWRACRNNRNGICGITLGREPHQRFPYRPSKPRVLRQHRLQQRGGVGAQKTRSGLLPEHWHGSASALSLVRGSLSRLI